jgi:hypothetical protein
MYPTAPSMPKAVNSNAHFFDRRFVEATDDVELSTLSSTVVTDPSSRFSERNLDTRRTNDNGGSRREG